jgi:hypothetical protein
VPITRVYTPDATLAGGIAADTGRGNLLRELQQLNREAQLRYAQLGESQRQYDLGLAARLQQSGLDRQFGYDQMAQRADQFQQGLQADVYAKELGIMGGLAQQDMQNQGYAAYQQQATQRNADTQLAQIAKLRQTQQFEKAMADREAILDYQRNGKLTEQGMQAAIQGWEQQNGMAWGLPDQLANQENDAAQQQRLANLANMVREPDTGAPVLSVDAISSYLEAGGEIKDVPRIQKDLLTASLKAKKDEWDRTTGFNEDVRKNDAHIADLARNDDMASQRIQQEAVKFARSQAYAAMKAVNDARIAFGREVQKWNTSIAAAETKARVDGTPRGPMPAMPLESDFVTPSLLKMQAEAEARVAQLDGSQQPTGGSKRINTQAEYDALAPGEEYIDAQTGTRGRKQ